MRRVCRMSRGMLSIGLATIGLTGCVNGPVRGAALGSGRFATVEFARDAEAPLVPPAAAAGLVADAAVVVPDTVSFAVVTVFVGPYQTVRSTFQPGVPAWRYVALPVTIPVGSLAYGVYTAVKPYDTMQALGWSEAGDTSDDRRPRPPRE